MIISSVLLFIVAGLASFMGRKFAWVYSFLVIFLLIYLNGTRQIQGDLISYESLLNELKISESLIKFKYITFDINEPIFIIYSYFFSVLNLGIDWLLGISTFLIYFFFLIAVRIYLNHFQGRKLDSLTLVVLATFTCLFSINFVVTGQLLKQYLSLSIVAIGVSAFLSGKNKLSIFSIVVGALIHSSSWIFALLLIYAYVNERLKLSWITKVIFVLVSLSICYFFVSDLLKFAASVLILNDGSIPLLLIATDALLVLLFICFGTNSDESFIKLKMLVYCYILGLIMVVGFEFIFLRMYFSYDVIRVFLICYLLVKVMKSIRADEFKLIASIILYSLSFFYLLFRISNSGSFNFDI